mgnify:CR=1 FL=1
MNPLDPKIPCAAPFAQMTLKPNGKAVLRCYQYHVEVGDLTKQTISEVWNGPKLQKIRRAFLEGNPTFCQTKMRNSNCQRSYADLSRGLEVNAIQKSPPRKLDVRLNSRCNLKCVMRDVYRGPNHLYVSG